MPNALDIAYALGLSLTAPFWFMSRTARRKVVRALHERTGKGVSRSTTGPAVLIHAVSLGEMNATPALVRELSSRRPELSFILSTTTDTGYARATELYGGQSNVAVVRYPLDFSISVNRFLDALRPSVAVLMELEVWPNFMAACERRQIPALLINGRLTTSSFRNYRRLRPLVAPMFRRLSAVCAQDQNYADRFILLGTPADRVKVTGTMKFDTAQVSDRIEGADDLAAALGLKPGVDPLWVCGSTGPGEEAIVLKQYRRLLETRPRLRLAIVPRHPQRFGEVAKLITAEGFGLVRRSEHGEAASDSMDASSILLGDTMGELRKFYSLASVVFVGRTLVDLGPRQHGSDMIEPAALANPVIVGPYTHNFAEAMNRFREAKAMREVKAEQELGDAVAELLDDSAGASEMGRAAQRVVRQEQGATLRHAKVILQSIRGGFPQLR